MLYQRQDFSQTPLFVSNLLYEIPFPVGSHFPLSKPLFLVMLDLISGQQRKLRKL